jgi:Family of unknown function (DUF6516)
MSAGRSIAKGDLTGASVGVYTNTVARLLLKERLVVAEDRFAEIVVWRLPRRPRGSHHVFKYRLAFVVDEVCVLRFDNETGKGDHKHVGDVEVPYAFSTLEGLITDFWDEVEQWQR